MKQITVNIDGQKVIVSELPIGKYAELIKALKQLPKHLAGFDQLNNDQIIEKLPEIITDSLPEFLDILAIATPLTKEQLQELGLAKIVKLVMAVMEVNEYKEIYDSIKKVLAPPPSQVERKETVTN